MPSLFIFLLEVFIDEKKMTYNDLGYKRFSWLSIWKALLSAVSRKALREVCIIHVGGGGPEDVSLLERCPHFTGFTLCISFNGVGGPEDVSILERCPHFRGCIYIHCVYT